MPRRVLHWFATVCAAVLLTGGQHGLLQTVAWANMLVTYHEDTGDWEQAVSMTFDGAHPCCMCKAIAQSRGTNPEAPRENTPGMAKISFPLPESIRFVLPARARCERRPPLALTASPFSPHAPPVPPPIAAG